MQKKFWNRMYGSQVMRGLTLETTRWFTKKQKTAFLWSTIVKVMMKHSIPPFEVKDFKNASYFNLSSPEKKL